MVVAVADIVADGYPDEAKKQEEKQQNTCKQLGMDIIVSINST